jgi:predicted permease
MRTVAFQFWTTAARFATRRLASCPEESGSYLARFLADELQETQEIADGYARLRATCEEMKRMAMNGMLLGRLGLLMRRFSRTPGFTAVTLATLAIGVGATTAIFSVVDGVLIKPLPYPHPEQLIGIWHAAPGLGIPELQMAPFLYFIDREQSTTLQDIGVYNDDSMTLTGLGDPERLDGMDVTSHTLPILGVQPVAGRLFSDADDTAGAPETVILSYAYWHKRFGGDTSAIGRVITLDGRPRQIIGVLPRSFRFLNNSDLSFMAPMQWDRSKIKLGNFSYYGLARMKPGVTLAQAQADMKRLIPIAVRSFPAPEGYSASIFESAGLAPNLRMLKQDVVGSIGNVLWVLLGSIAMVLMIACANVANLLLVRVEGRRQELAIRAALGANWKRIASDLMLESLALGVLGATLGLALADVALRLLVAAAPTGLPRLDEIGINGTVLLFAFALALVTSAAIGALPVLKYAGSRVNLTLREGGRGQSQSREQHRARNVLVVVQIAMALVLLICSGLMIRTFQALTHVDPGFSLPNTLQTFQLYIPETQAKGAEQTMRIEQAIRDRIATLPGVKSVAFGTALPMSGSNNNDVLYAQDQVYSQGTLPPVRRFKFYSPGMFATLGTRIVIGRDFNWNDLYQKKPVAVISENMAREMWHEPSAALGKRIRVATTDEWREIVGVVSDSHDNGVDQAAPATVYWPALTGHFEGDSERIQRYIAVAIRSDRAGSSAFMKEVQQAVWSADSDLPLADVHTLGYYYTRSMARTSFTLVMLSVAGGMALLLGVVGIYGVISYSVAQRTREIGIRMALGAQRQAITQMFVRNGLLLTGVGVVIGLATSFGVMRFLSSLLFGVNPIDPVTYGTITLLIVAIAWIACYLPSRRASAVDPMDALRSE